MTTGFSPGHVDFFKDIFGRNPEYEKILESWVEQAKENNVDTLIISQEDLCRLNDSQWANIKEALNNCFVHLIISHRSIKKRVASQWQERVKHGNINKIEAVSEIVEEERFNPILHRSIANSLSPQKISIVTAGIHEKSNKLIARFLECIEVDGFIREHGNAIDSEMKINVSHGRIETEFIRHLNLLCEYLTTEDVPFDYKFMRKCLVDMMLSDRWKKNIDKLPIIIPNEFITKIEKRAEEIHIALFEDFKLGKIEVYGDIGHVLE